MVHGAWAQRSPSAISGGHAATGHVVFTCEISRQQQHETAQIFMPALLPPNTCHPHKTPFRSYALSLPLCKAPACSMSQTGAAESVGDSAAARSARNSPSLAAL